MGNSSYGKTITDQERHRELQFCEKTKASRLRNKPFFRQIDQIDENTYEVHVAREKIKLNLPMQIGFFVYQYAKLRIKCFSFIMISWISILIAAIFSIVEWTPTLPISRSQAGQSVESLVEP